MDSYNFIQIYQGGAIDKIGARDKFDVHNNGSLYTTVYVRFLTRGKAGPKLIISK